MQRLGLYGMCSLAEDFCFLFGHVPAHAFLSTFKTELCLVFDCQPDITFEKWELELCIAPRTQEENNITFKNMVKRCKISKLGDCQYKIIFQCLATPKVLSCVWGQPSLAKCVWCGLEASLFHCIVNCQV